MNKFVILIALTGMLFAGPANAARQSPEDVLEAYFTVLTSRKVDNLGELMSEASMNQLRDLMIRAFEFEKSRGRDALEQRFFGKATTMETIASLPPSYFLDRFAREILEAAELQHFFVDNRDIIGSVRESRDVVHFVVRLYLHQDEEAGSDLLLYTLIRENGVWKLTFPPTIRQTLAVFEAGLRRSGMRP